MFCIICENFMHIFDNKTMLETIIDLVCLINSDFHWLLTGGTF